MKLRREDQKKEEPSAARKFAHSVKKGVCLAAAPVLTVATLLASPEHIFKNGAPIPLAITRGD
jgi:hypothetical protein